MYFDSPKFDFSAAKVQLVASRPKPSSGQEAELYGQLKLKRVVRDWVFKGRKAIPPLMFEV
jgi:hypothetical protein